MVKQVKHSLKCLPMKMLSLMEFCCMLQEITVTINNLPLRNCHGHQRPDTKHAVSGTKLLVVTVNHRGISCGQYSIGSLAICQGCLQHLVEEMGDICSPKTLS